MLWFRNVCIEKQDQERLCGRHGTYTGSSRTGRRWTREQSEGDTRPLEWENLRVPRSTPRIIMWFVPKWQGMGHTSWTDRKQLYSKAMRTHRLLNTEVTWGTSLLRWYNDYSASYMHAGMRNILEWGQPFHNRTARKTRSASVSDHCLGHPPEEAMSSLLIIVMHLPLPDAVPQLSEEAHTSLFISLSCIPMESTCSLTDEGKSRSVVGCRLAAGRAQRCAPNERNSCSPESLLPYNHCKTMIGASTPRDPS